MAGFGSNPFGDGLSVTVTSETEGFTSGITDATDAIGGMKTAVIGVGGALTALAAGGLAKSISAAREFETAMSEIEKVASAEVAEEMNSEIREMSEEIPMTQEALAGLAADASRFGVEGTENIKNFTETAAKMSSATTLNADEAGESLAKLAQMTNTPISEVENLGSAINELSNNYATSSDEIVGSMQRSATALSNLGLSNTQITGLSASLNAVSESSERAGSRLRRLAQEAMNPKKAGDMAAALGMTEEEFKTMREEDPSGLIMKMIEAFDKGGESAEALRSSLSTTSTQALSGLASNSEEVAAAMDMSAEAYEENTSLQSEFNKEMDTFNAKMKTFKNQINNIAIRVGNNLLPPLTKLLGWVSDAIDTFAEFDKQTGGMASTFTLIGSLLAGLALTISGVVSALGGTSAILAAVGSAVTLLTGPVGIAIALIALLGAAWATNFMGIRDKTKAVIDFLVPKIKSAFKTIKNVITSVIKFIWNTVYKPIIGRMTSYWSKEGDKTKNNVMKTFNAIKGFIVTIFKFLQKIFQVYIDIYTKLWDMFGDEIIAVVKAFVAVIKPVVMQFVDALVTSFNVLMALLRGDFSAAWGFIEGYIERTVGRMKEFLGAAIDAIVAYFDLVFEVWGKVGDVAMDAVDAVIGAFDPLTSFFSDLWSGILNGVTGFATDLVDSLVGLADDAANAFKDAFNSIIPSSVSIPEVDLGPAGTYGGDSIGLPQLASGGFIEKGGLAQLHEGEIVTPAAQVDRGKTGGGTTVKVGKIEANTEEGGREAARGLRDELNSAGL